MNQAVSIRQSVQESLQRKETKTFTLGDGRADGEDLRAHLTQLANLVANVTESYTTSIFIANNKERVVELVAWHTLSRELVPQAKISFGCGLVGWTAENKVRISVCPFEHDATTLLYYHSDQDLKSFIALPVMNGEELLGVIACDSKKTYAFSKILEKQLSDCARQVAILVQLHAKTKPEEKPILKENSVLRDFLEELRSQRDEKSLLWAAASFPEELVRREALAIVTTPEEGIGDGSFYSKSSRENLDHRLLELVCRHKKVICSNRSVQSLPADDVKNRSFLSVPFRVLDAEAGSFNLLGFSHEAFDAEAIATVEQVAQVVGLELERVRLRAMHNSSMRTTGILSWKSFEAQASYRLAEAKLKNERLDLIRISLENLGEIEALAGVSIATSVMQRLMRLVDQVKVGPSLACYLYGCEMLLLVNSDEAPQVTLRLKRLVERLGAADFISDQKMPNIKVGSLILGGLSFSSARFPDQGLSLSQLVKHTRGGIEYGSSDKGVEVAINARN